jgi:hypothetical protein
MRFMTVVCHSASAKFGARIHPLSLVFCLIPQPRMRRGFNYEVRQFSWLALTRKLAWIQLTSATVVLVAIGGKIGLT